MTLPKKHLELREEAFVKGQKKLLEGFLQSTSLKQDKEKDKLLKYKAYQAVLYEHSFTNSKETKAKKLDKNYSKYALQPHIDEKLEVLHPSYIRNKRNEARFLKAKQEMFDLMKQNLEKLEVTCTRNIKEHEIESVQHIFGSNRRDEMEDDDDANDNTTEKRETSTSEHARNKTVASRRIDNGDTREANTEKYNEIQAPAKKKSQTEGLKPTDDKEALESDATAQNPARKEAQVENESQLRKEITPHNQRAKMKQTTPSPENVVRGKKAEEKKKNSETPSTDTLTGPVIPIIRENSNQIDLGDDPEDLEEAEAAAFFDAITNSAQIVGTELPSPGLLGPPSILP